MADTRFVRAVDALYAVLDLPAPLRGEVGDDHVLLADDTEVTVSLSPNGRAALVSAPIGHLPPADPMRSEKARNVLGMALAMMRSNAAAVVVDREPEPDGRRAVRALARASLEGDALLAGEQLKIAVEEVLDQVSVHRPTLAETSGRLPAPETGRAAAETAAAPSLIFRP